MSRCQHTCTSCVQESPGNHAQPHTQRNGFHKANLAHLWAARQGWCCAGREVDVGWVAGAGLSFIHAAVCQDGGDEVVQVLAAPTLAGLAACRDT